MNPKRKIVKLEHVNYGLCYYSKNVNLGKIIRKHIPEDESLTISAKFVAHPWMLLHQCSRPDKSLCCEGIDRLFNHNPSLVMDAQYPFIPLAR